MITKKELEREQVLFAIEKGEFDSSVVNDQETVILILTQDWCPQWQYLKSWVFEINTDKLVSIYYIEYNRKDYFKSFRTFKEDVLRNDQVPYIRYYKNGKLMHDSNYVNKNKFIELGGL